MHEFFQYEHIRNLPSNFPCAQAPLAAIKGRKWRTVFTHGDLGPHNSSGPGGYKKSGDWCNHRLGVFRMVSWVLGMYKTYHGPASAFKGFDWWEIFQDHVECSREELEADIIFSAYLSINLWKSENWPRRSQATASGQDCRLMLLSRGATLRLLDNCGYPVRC